MRELIKSIVLSAVFSLMLVFGSVAIAADVATDEDTSSLVQDETAATNPDPYEWFNRPVFWFNDRIVDRFVLKPIATGYNAIMPRPLNQGVHNFFVNLSTIPTIINDVLQFHFFQAANDSWRLLINTTIGVGGLFDIAERIHLKPYKNDFGMTLATWGWKNSNYLVLPFLGPGSPRDGLIAIPVDYYLFSVYPHIYPQRTRYALLGLFVIDFRAQLLQFQDVYDTAALDRYAFVRNVYLQKRASQLKANEHRSYDDLADQFSAEPVATAGGEAAADSASTEQATEAESESTPATS